MSTAIHTVSFDVRLGPGDRQAALHDDVQAGLSTRPFELAPKWFYDDCGAALFEAITRLPEYYPTRREREILDDHAGEVALLSRPETLVELGSGTSEKTRLLLDATWGGPGLARFVPFDVSEATLRRAALAAAEAYPGLAVHAVVGDFGRHLAALSETGEGRRLVVFLGGTIGNLHPPQRRRFLADMAAAMTPGDSLLLGTDLVKDRRRLEAAYDDAAGVTAAFNRNLLNVLNRELGADFSPDRFEHVARWREPEEWVEMGLRSVGPQRVRLAALGMEVALGDGEEVRTEISAKFRRSGVEAELGAAGFEVARWWTDRAGDFGLSLSFLA